MAPWWECYSNASPAAAIQWFVADISYDRKNSRFMISSLIKWSGQSYVYQLLKALAQFTIGYYA